MRKSIVIIGIAALSFGVLTGMAEPPKQANTKLDSSNAAQITSTTQSASNSASVAQNSKASGSTGAVNNTGGVVSSIDSQQQVLLYEQANTSSNVLAKLVPSTRLIPIFQQKDWIKVGNAENGQVGWVNIKQYRQAQAAYFQPNFQAMFIQVDHDSKGKPTVNVIAYQNGKKLDDQQAKALYENVKKQQESQYREMEHFSNSANALLDTNFINMQRLFDSSMFNAPWGQYDLRPIIIFQPAKTNTDTNENGKNSAAPVQNKAS